MKTKLPHHFYSHIRKQHFLTNDQLEKQSQLLSLAFAKTQNNCNELSRAVLIYNNLTYNIQSSFIL